MVSTVVTPQEPRVLVSNITDLVQMSNATRNVAEFGNHKANGGIRAVVEIGDGMSLQGYARTINYSVSGSADRGESKDYTIDGCTSSTCSVKLPANRYSVPITIYVNNDGQDEMDETIVITLKDGSGYTVNQARKTTTVTIRDDDTRGLTFHRRWADVAEGSSATYTVKLKSQPTAPVEVFIASDNPDVTTDPSTLLFNPTFSIRWDTAQMVTVNAAQDNDAVDDMAILTHTTSGGDYGGANAITVKRGIPVDDDDTATTPVSQVPYISVTAGSDVTEGGAASFKVIADPAPTSRLTVNVEVFESPNQDFIAASQEGVRTVVLNAGASSATFTVTTVDDQTDEDDGTVGVYVNDGTGYTAGQGDSVAILDNDEPTPAASFDLTSSDAVEHGGTHEVRVNLDYPAPAAGITLRYSLSGTATAGSGNDYTIENSGTVMIPERSANATIAIAINDDSSKENAETVVLTLIGGTGYTVDSPSAHTLTIEDNDSTSASFATATAIVAESAGTHNVAVNLNQAAPTGGLTINYRVAGTATAASGNDFTIANSGSLSIAAGATSANIPVAINDDSAEEAAETVILTLTGGTGYTLGSPTTHTLTITENDRPPIFVSRLSSLGGSPLPEGAGFGTNIKLNRSLRPDEMATLPVIIGGTATRGTDYRLSCVSQEPQVFFSCSGLAGNNPTVTLNGAFLHARTTGRATGPLYLEALEDNTAESNETVVLALGVGGRPLTVTITDAPSSATVSFTHNTFSVNESFKFQPVFQLSPPMGRDLTIPLIFTDITATSGSDYTPITQAVLEATGQETQSPVNIAITDDSIYEGDETFTMAIDTANLPTGVSAGTHTTATVTIEDDDPAPNSPQLVLSRSSLTVAEGSTGSYTLKLATQPTGTVTVNIASNNPDLSVSPNPVTFQSSGSSKLWSVAQTITVTAAQDNDSTNDTATLNHTASGGGYGSVTGSVSVTVNDDDGPSNHRPVLEDGMADQTATAGSAFNYTFSANAFIDRDGDSLTYTAKLLTNNVEGPLPVWLTLNSSTRTFSGTPGSGDTGTLLIRVWADDSNGGTASGTFILTVSPATNNVPTASFGSASSSAAENAGTRSVNVNLSSAAPSGGLTLSYGVAGTATAGSGNDFTIQNSGSLAIAAGATTATIAVAINDDSNQESDETVILTLTDGTGYSLGSTTVHTLTITDNDTTRQATLSLRGPTSTDEGDSGTTDKYFTVTLSSAPSRSVSWRLCFTGTATIDAAGGTTLPANADYQAIAGQTPIDLSDSNPVCTDRVFRPAEALSNTELGLRIQGDTEFERDETVIATLSIDDGPADVVLGTAVATYTIRNDDTQEAPAKAMVSVSDAQGYKACEMIAFKVSVNRGIDAGTEPDGIGLAVSTRESTPKTAEAGTDFRAKTEIFQFNPGDNLSKRFQVNLIESPNDNETPKTFEVFLHDVSGADIADGVGTGTILDEFPVDGCHTPQASVPLLPSGSIAHPQGVVQIVNPSTDSGELEIVAIDDAGWQRQPITLAIGAEATHQFTSQDLEVGNETIGLQPATGAGRGDWRLELDSALDLTVNPSVRSLDGSLQPMAAVVPLVENSHTIALFHPADHDALGQLRLTNRGGQPLQAHIAGIDDQGNSPGEGVSIEIPAAASVRLTATELEAGSDRMTGALGDGAGLWRLRVTADGELVVMNLIETSAGDLINGSNATLTPVQTEQGTVVAQLPSHTTLSTTEQQSILRLVNRAEQAGTVHIQPLDLNQGRYPPLTLSLAAGEAVNLDRWDLNLGYPSFGTGLRAQDTDTLQLAIRSDVDVGVMTYVRSANGGFKRLPEAFIAH